VPRGAARESLAALLSGCGGQPAPSAHGPLYEAARAALFSSWPSPVCREWVLHVRSPLGAEAAARLAGERGRGAGCQGEGRVGLRRGAERGGREGGHEAEAGESCTRPGPPLCVSHRLYVLAAGEEVRLASALWHTA
jgi:hypothetical protein